MRRATLIGLLIVLGLSSSPSAAQAGVWELGRAQAVAGKAWGYPCSGRPEFVYSDKFAGTYDAWVNFQDVNNVAVPECRIHLDTSMRDAPWSQVCRVVLHEYGHLAGIYSHSSDPANIMYERPPDDPRCERRGRPFLGLAEPRTAKLRAKYR
jgi:hypothetical protein